MVRGDPPAEVGSQKVRAKTQKNPPGQALGAFPGGPWDWKAAA